MRLARTYWEIPSEFWEIGVQYGPRAAGSRSVLNPNFEEWRWYFPICPSQTHSVHIVINLIKAWKLSVPLINKNKSISCPSPVLANTWGGHDTKNISTIMSPPPVLLNTGGGHDTKNFLLSCPPHVLCNTGGGHDSKIFSLPSGWPGMGKYIGGTSI